MMSPEPVNNRSSLLPATNSRFSTTRIQEFKQLKQDTNEKTFSSAKPQDEKANIIINDLNEEVPNPQNDFRFQINTPVAKLLEVIKGYNESKKIYVDEKSDDDSDEYAEFSEIEQGDVGKKEGIGFYVVLGDKATKVLKQFPKTRFDLIREKIVNTYQTGFRKENGSLVNLTI
jgi:hypothetical protein